MAGRRRTAAARASGPPAAAKSRCCCVEVTNEIGDRAAGVRHNPVHGLQRNVVDVAHNDLTSVAALHDFLPIWSGNDFSAQVNAPRSARKNEYVSKVVVAFRGGSYVATLDATIVIWISIVTQIAGFCQLFHCPDIIRGVAQRGWLAFAALFGLTADLG